MLGGGRSREGEEWGKERRRGGEMYRYSKGKKRKGRLKREK